MILLVSNKWDISLDFVVRELRRRNELFLRLNSEDLPYSALKVSFPDFAFVLPSRIGPQDLAGRLKSVLLRRPGKPFSGVARDDPRSPGARYAQEQWHSLIDGLMSLEGVLWINHPLAGYRMESKIVQMQAAHGVGFAVPRTCITTSKEIAAEFINLCGGRAVAKSLSSSLIEYPDSDYFVFTNIVRSIDDIPSEEIGTAPIIFQEYVDGKSDYRVTVVGDKVFVVRILSREGRSLPGDWRLERADLKFIPAQLPQDVSDMCVELVTRNGLVFGAIDLVQDDDGFYFLEINPNGEWGWLQTSPGLPIAEALAARLSQGS